MENVPVERAAKSRSARRSGGDGLLAPPPKPCTGAGAVFGVPLAPDTDGRPGEPSGRLGEPSGKACAGERDPGFGGIPRRERMLSRQDPHRGASRAFGRGPERPRPLQMAAAGSGLRPQAGRAPAAAGPRAGPRVRPRPPARSLVPPEQVPPVRLSRHVVELRAALTQALRRGPGPPSYPRHGGPLWSG